MIYNDPYKNDYDHRPVKDEKGRFKDEFYYTGERTELGLDEAQKKKASRRKLLTAVVLLAATVLPGLPEHPASRVLWVTLPWVICFLPAGFFLMGAVEYASNGLALSRREYDHSVKRMHRSTVGLLILGVLNMILAAVYTVLHFDVTELLYIASFIPVTGICFLRRKE
ncbi:MAG: hypothetical protein IK115_02870 [Lachnospiraceae bacterium]|nr:hypothetical protein [Lachnospiraceae bacterium]